MTLYYIPLLQIQRDLLDIPRGPARFEEYLRTVLNDDRSDVELVPLLHMNPMSKEHVMALLDAYLTMGADKIAAQVCADAVAQLSDEPGEFKATLVLADDLMGGWTNRYACEYDHRRLGPGNKRFWVHGILWSSEPATELAAREAILTAICRTAYVQRHGPAKNLRELLAQEGQVLAWAGCTRPALEKEDLDYTREVLLPYLDSTDMRTCIECMFGDEAGRSLGFTPRGLSPWAGIALALHDARSERQVDP